jgi:hypothetical protein
MIEKKPPVGTPLTKEEIERMIRESRIRVVILNRDTKLNKLLDDEDDKTIV